MNIPSIPVGSWFETLINWLTEHLEGFFDGIGAMVTGILDATEFMLMLPHPLVLILLFTTLAWFAARHGVAIFTLLGMLLIYNMGYWPATMETLSLVLASVLIALLLGVPLGIWCAKKPMAEQVMRPILDFMQTLPAFVYLIPAVLFFKLGPVPGVIATLIFSLPPAVRLTSLGIRQVPEEIREAALSFGSNPRQLLFKAELPVAMPTIMAGINQTIMLALSMVVISGMIGAGGLGNEVLKGITQLKIDVGFEAGISIVILAIFLDRVTQQLGRKPKNK
jgi:glycine betaine/proline transport system permease protein